MNYKWIKGYRLANSLNDIVIENQRLKSSDDNCQVKSLGADFYAFRGKFSTLGEKGFKKNPKFIDEIIVLCGIIIALKKIKFKLSITWLA